MKTISSFESNRVDQDPPGDAAPQRNPDAAHLNEQRSPERTGPSERHGIAGVNADLFQVAAQPPTAVNPHDAPRLSSM
jgi:hypothetical protein